VEVKNKISITQKVKQGQGPVYFLGIGGIGMSALARYFISMNRKVSGYDRVSTPLTKKLEAEGINIHYIDDVNLLDPLAELVVYTPAVHFLPGKSSLAPMIKARRSCRSSGIKFL